MSKKDKKAEQTAPEQQEPMEETQAQAETQRAPIPSSPSWSP